MKYLPTLASLLMLLPLAAQAQTIRGVVVEDGTRRPVVGVHVELFDAGRSPIATTRSDSAGTFVLLPRRGGSFTLRLTHLAFVPIDSVALTVRPQESVDVELRMGSRAIPIEPLVVTARVDARLAGFHERMRRHGFGRFITRAEIDERPGTVRTTDLLRTMPGVNLVAVQRCPGCTPTYLITMRGGAGGCMPTVYLDGMPIRQFEESGVDDFLLPSMIEGVEVYTSFASAPAPVHAQNACGVVAFWTRSGEPGGRWSWRRFFTAAGLVTVFAALSHLFVR
jgi:hypothetical protein